MDRAVVDYILQAQKHGLTDFEIKQNLLSAGWEADVVESGFSFAKANLNQHLSDFQTPHINQNNLKISSVTALEQPASQTLEKKPGHYSLSKNKLIAAVLAGFLLLFAVGCYAYYNFVYFSPAKVWDRFLMSGPTNSFGQNFKINYTDKTGGKNDTADNQDIKNLNLTVEGNGFEDTSDKQNPKGNAKIKITFGAGDSAYALNFSYIFLNDYVYFDLSKIPSIASLLSAGNENKSDWVKINLSGSDAKGKKNANNSDPQTAFDNVFNASSLLKVSSVVGQEKIQGVTVLHFKNSINNQTLKTLAEEYINKLAQKLAASGKSVEPDQIGQLKQLTTTLANKIKILDFETWIGQKDSKLYQIHVLTNAPTFSSLAQALSDLSPENKNAKRLDDIRKIEAAMELYKMDNGGYPEGQGGKPLSFMPAYLSNFPQAPQADGSCTDYYNTYWYKPQGNKKTNNGKTVYSSYTLTFCLSADTGGYKAGVGKLTPGGIAGNIPCPGTKEQCVKDNASGADNGSGDIKNLGKKLDFSATLDYLVTYSDYGKKIEIKAPQNAVDITNNIQKDYSDPKQPWLK